MSAHFIIDLSVSETWRFLRKRTRVLRAWMNFKERKVPRMQQMNYTLFMLSPSAKLDSMMKEGQAYKSKNEIKNVPARMIAELASVKVLNMSTKYLNGVGAVVLAVACITLYLASPSLHT